MSTLYHNTRCSKSRAALEYLTQLDLSFTVVDYIKNPIGKDKITELCKKLNLQAIDLIRTKDQLFKDLSINNVKSKDNDFWITILEKYPNLLERPIYETLDSAAIGRPLENIIEITHTNS